MNEKLNADECIVLGCTCASVAEDGPIDVIIVTLLTDDGDTLSLAFNEQETKKLIHSILERVGGYS